MTTKEQVVAFYQQRLRHYQPLHARMQTVANIYDGNVTVPLPDMERNEASSVPNLLAVGVDQTAGRIASVIPAINFASMRPGVRKYDRRAADAARAVGGWWQLDRVSNQLKQRARHLITYAMSPNMMRWDPKTHRPHWEWRDPRTTYPSIDLLPGSVAPTDCIFAYKRSVAYLRECGYGTAVTALTQDPNTNNDTLVLLIEYVDCDETILVAAGWKTTWEQASYSGNGQGLVAVELERFPNPTGMCPVTLPTRIALNGPMGQFDTMVPMYYTQARLMALEVIAIEKDIYPDTYLESRQGEIGRFDAGPFDGRTGKVNIVSGGVIRNVQSQPGYMTPQAIDRLERNQRVTAGIPQELGGESGSGIRTGRRGDAVLGAAIDFPIAEAQELFAYALERENEIGMALAKQYDGTASRTIYVGTGNTNKPVTYIADETFENTEHTVSYPVTGVDVNTLNIQVGQLLGQKMMSVRTAQTLSPLISDPEGEHDQIIAEGLESALLLSIEQGVQNQQIPPLTLARIKSLVQNDKMELAEAMVKVAADAAKEQQAQNPAPTPDEAVAQAGAAPTLQGLAGGIPNPNQDQPGLGNLSNLMAQLRRPNMPVQPMRGVAQGAV